MTLQPRHIYSSVVIMVGLIMLVLTASYAYYVNQGFGFPLDDPWIHLQFAKNLHDYGSFSYYKNEMATSGSTSPLYTLILSLGFFVTSNEMMLSYVAGALFLLIGSIYLYRLAEQLFPGKAAYPIVAALLLVLESHLQWIALSGMETTLFILLLLATAYYYHARRPVPLGISAGLLLWTRPEAIILFGVMAIDLVYQKFIQTHGSEEDRPSNSKPLWTSWTLKALVILAAFGFLYVGFNLFLSGSILPNTYAAKVKYYAEGGEDFPLQVVKFLSSGALMVFAPVLVVGIIVVLRAIVRRERTRFLIPLLFSLGLFGAYWWKLPYLYQNGRYLMPILPFIVLLGLEGMNTLFIFLRPRVKMLGPEKTYGLTQRVVMVVFVISFAYGSWEGRVMYQDYCKYISDRQVRTAHWIHDHLPETAVIATHDVGAIAFYSGRKIVDMVGLISPEAIASIRDRVKLRELLIREHVTHLALLRNWFEVVNINPMFQTNEQTPEIMEVFAFDTARAHLTSKQVNWLTNTGWAYLSIGDVQHGGPLVERAVQLDPQSSRAHHHFAWALMMVGQLDRAEAELHKAIDLQPDNWNAQFALTQVPLRRGDTTEGIKRLEHLLKLNPKMLAAHQVLADIYEAKGDTARARASLEALAAGTAEQDPVR